MISSIHTIKVALAGDYNFARVAAVEDEQGDVIRLDISFWHKIEIAGEVSLDCGEHETLFAYDSPEIQDVCFAGVWNIDELRTLLDEFGEDDQECVVQPEPVENATCIPNPV